MAKDPAFLFYSSDFLTGTMFMSHEQVGKYIRLLCAQHQIGHLNEKDMLNICGSYDEVIFSKFKKDSDGKFFNERCEEEILRRKAYSESRRKNKNSKKEHMSNISKTYDKHMETENENVIETINDTKFIIVSDQKIFDPMPVIEWYEVQLNGMQKENGNLAWRPMVNAWFLEHIGEEFADGMHAKNSFKKHYYRNLKQPIDQKQQRKKAFEL